MFDGCYLYMPHRYQQDQQDQQESEPTSLKNPKSSLKLFYAIREKLKEGYSLADFRADLMSGIVVGIVAIPLGMALAMASGVPPQYGLYTVIIAGILVSLLGGSRFQVTGPTAAFVVILAPIAMKYGLGGLLTAGLMAGIILLFMGLARMGKLIQFIPYPVTTGFTSGIAVVIATLQLKDFFGLQISQMPEHYLEKLAALIHFAPTVSWMEFGIGLLTFFLLLAWPKINRKIPAPLVVLVFVSLFAAAIKSKFPTLSITTIGTRFPGIPEGLPHFTLPWFYGEGSFALSLHSIEALIPSAFAIAMLGAIESLLSAVVADGMAQTKHDPDSELVALGIGNILSPFFGGIAATGAIARTATNIRFGAKSPFSAIIHGFFTLFVILLFAPYVSYLPTAALSALLILVAYNMSEIKRFRHILKVGPKSDVIVLLICFSLTILFDMVIGVTAGILLAALLFMKRMATVTSSQILTSQSRSPVHPIQVPLDVLLYDINGPLFFGAAETAMEAMAAIGADVKVVFLLMEDVPVMDVTGLVALEGTVADLLKGKKKVYLVGVKSQPRQLMLKSPSLSQAKQLFFCSTVDDALSHYHQERAE